MNGLRTRLLFAVTAVALGSLAVLGGFVARGPAAAQAERLRHNRCMRLSKVTSLFPAAPAVGFSGRSPITYQPARDVGPGWCSDVWTTYSGDGQSVDVSVTLYKTAKDVGAAFAELGVSGVHVLRNGARVLIYGPEPADVAGTPGSATSAYSAFRKLFIESDSISTSMAPVPIAAQLKIHRRIENAFARLGARHLRTLEVEELGRKHLLGR
jgi:hypothetical protein